MTASSRSTQVLGLDRRRGWRLLHLPNGHVQIDLGAVGLVLNPVEFQAWTALLRRAVTAPPQAEVLAAPQPDQCVLFCAAHDLVTIAFGPCRVRLRPSDLPELSRLCTLASRALPPTTWRPTPALTTSPFSQS